MFANKQSYRIAFPTPIANVDSKAEIKITGEGGKGVKSIGKNLIQ